MIGDLTQAGSMFTSAPLTSADFQFSNDLVTVDPNTGIPLQSLWTPSGATAMGSQIAQASPPSGGTAASSLAIGSTGPSSGNSWLALVAIAAVVAYFYWPQIKAEWSKYAG